MISVSVAHEHNKKRFMNYSNAKLKIWSVVFKIYVNSVLIVVKNQKINSTCAHFSS